MNRSTKVGFRLTIMFLGAVAVASAQKVETVQTAQSTRVGSAETGQTAALTGGTQVSEGRPTAQRRNPRYQVMRDDILSVSFPISPELNQKVMVQPDGYITLQSIGSVYIQGMTVPEVVESLKKAYSGVLHDPIIDVDLTDFQKPYFIASGQVGKAGQYDLRHDTTVSEAIALAGGFLPTAKTQVFLYHRVSAGWVEVKKLSLKDLLNGKNVNEDVEIQPGDMIFVPEKYITNFRKYVPYTLGLYLNPLQSF